MARTAATSTSCTVGALPSTSCLAAAPAALPTLMYQFSMRVEEKATAEAETATGTSRLAPTPLRGTMTANGVSYQFTLPQLGEKREKVRMPLDQFKPSYRGRAVPDAPPLRAAEVRGMGLMLSRYEGGGGEGKQPIAPGDFWLRLRRLEATESELTLNGRRWAQRD